MGKIFSQFGSYLLHPIKTVRRLLLSGPVGLGSFIIIIYLALMIAANIIAAPDAWHSKPFDQINILALQMLALGFAIIIIVSIVHLSADFLGGAGRGISLFYLQLAAMLPFILSKLSAILFLSIFQHYLVHQVILVICLLWFAVLTTANVKELYRFTWIKAFSTLLIPAILVLLLAVILATGIHSTASDRWFQELIRGFLHAPLTDQV